MKAPSVRHLIGVWLGLLVLLTLTAASAYLKLGIGNTLINMAIAAAKVGLVAVFFMHLRHSDATVRLASSTALLFLFILAFLTFGDFLTRPMTPADWRPPQAVDLNSSKLPSDIENR